MMDSICWRDCWRISLIFACFCCGVSELSAQTDSTWLRVPCSISRRCSIAAFEMPACCQQGGWCGALTAAPCAVAILGAGCWARAATDMQAMTMTFELVNAHFKRNMFGTSRDDETRGRP